MTRQYNLESQIYNRPDENLSNEGATLDLRLNCWMPGVNGQVVYASTSAVYATANVPVNGTYYIGFCLSGWDGQQTSTTTIYDVKIL